MPKITDVAAHAGVSMKTVSRVLNGEAHVRPAVIERVKRAVEELDYRPNLAARQLAGHKSFIIAYPFFNPSPGYITDSLVGAAEACRDRGYHLVSEPIEPGPEARPVIDRMMRTLRPDGVILTPPLCDLPEIVDQIARFNAPLVRISGGEDTYGRAIVIDERSASRRMTEHLIEMGHRRIGFIEPHPEHKRAQTRFHGYRDALIAAGIEFEPELVRPGQFDVESGVRAGRELLSLARRPSAIYAANDDMALGALQVAHELGLSIPDDLAIAGFDDTPASRLAWPPLTTIRQPVRQLGGLAALMLTGNNEAEESIECELVVRRSTRAEHAEE